MIDDAGHVNVLVFMDRNQFDYAEGIIVTRPPEDENL
jgi:hypothetical protein